MAFDNEEENNGCEEKVFLRPYQSIILRRSGDIFQDLVSEFSVIESLCNRTNSSAVLFVSRWNGDEKDIV